MPLSSGCRQVPNMRGEHVLAKKYQIRLRFAPTSCSRSMLKGLFLIWTVITILQTAMQGDRCARELDALWQRGKRGASEAGAGKKLEDFHIWQWPIWSISWRCWLQWGFRAGKKLHWCAFTVPSRNLAVVSYQCSGSAFAPFALSFLEGTTYSTLVILYYIAYNTPTYLDLVVLYEKKWNIVKFKNAMCERWNQIIYKLLI